MNPALTAAVDQACAAMQDAWTQAGVDTTDPTQWTAIAVTLAMLDAGIPTDEKQAHLIIAVVAEALGDQ